MHRFFPLALLTFLALSGCKQPAPPEVQIVRPAQVWTVTEQNIAAEQRFAGELRARFEADLAFRVGGKVVERAVELGQVVSAGQVLARLDAADLDLGVSSAQASLAGAEADKLNAQQELTRVQGLYEQKFLGKSALDAAIAARNAAAARVDALRAQSKQSGLQAQYSALQASKPGIITAVNVELGQVVAAGTSVLRIAYAGEREVHLRVGEASAPLFAQALQQQQALPVNFWSRPGKSFEGRVREIAPVTDNTRSVLVKISLPQVPDDLPLGATAEVTLQSAPPAGEVWLPATALFQEAEKPAVWLLTADNNVQLHTVSVLRYTHDGVLVRGLTPGQQVIAAGVHTLNAGQIVRPIPFEGHVDVHVDTKEATQVSQ